MRMVIISMLILLLLLSSTAIMGSRPISSTNASTVTIGQTLINPASHTISTTATCTNYTRKLVGLTPPPGKNLKELVLPPRPRP
jgi:hypothetical protein